MATLPKNPRAAPEPTRRNIKGHGLDRKTDAQIAGERRPEHHIVHHPQNNEGRRAAHGAAEDPFGHIGGFDESIRRAHQMHDGDIVFTRKKGEPDRVGDDEQNPQA